MKVKHEFFVCGNKNLEEFQDIVYKEKVSNNLKLKKELPFVKSDIEETVFTHPTLLFRYSAITFNGHRIHYDYQYCRNEENYKNLVFHGPLQATFLLRISEKLAKKRVKNFTHKGLSPVFANENLKIDAILVDKKEIQSFTSTDEAGLTMYGKALF